MQVNIGIIGLGTIGFGVYEILRDNRENLNKKHNLNLVLKAIADPNIDNLEEDFKNIELYKEGSRIANDTEIDLAVLLIGGTGIELDLMKLAIKNKKHIITANKAIISEFGEEIFTLARENKVSIHYEAAVGGVIPVVETTENYLAANSIKSIKGIFNGTCNFILTKMDQGLSYEEALKITQEKGFAEADPTLDVNGADTAHKITILSRLAFGNNISINDIDYKGITDLTDEDFSKAKQKNCKIKLMGSANDKGEVYVEPVVISNNDVLSRFDNEYNAIIIEGDYSGPILLAGKGAGRYPTAIAVVNDIIKAAKLL